MFGALLNRSITILRRPADANYDEFRDGAPEPERIAAKGALDQRQASERGEEVPQGDWRLFLAAGEEIGPGDAVEIDGITYEVTGEPWPVEDKLGGRISHIEVGLNRAGSRAGQ